MVELWLVVVDVDELDVDGGVAEPLILTLSSCSGSDLSKTFIKSGPSDSMKLLASIEASLEFKLIREVT